MVARAAAVKQAVEQVGWTFLGAAQPATGMAAGLGYEITNMCAGLVDGEPVTTLDVVQLMRGWSNETGPTDTFELGDHQTYAQMGFPAAFRLTVTQETSPGRDAFIRTGPRVDLESSEFADRFHVYCDDQVLARMVLNPNVMATLMSAPYPVGLLIQKNLLQLSTPGTLVPPQNLTHLAAVAGKLRYSALSASAASTSAR
jgi:Protein of unknown function (DUF3137)